ncbi:MAG: flagellar hook-basal body complex protein FliE [Desulfobulbaceae bacterium A2]|nr:MAG: flagellar hook-basal body complex protein FliE [Desulfobulbaceae bacterium A2]
MKTITALPVAGLQPANKPAPARQLEDSFRDLLKESIDSTVAAEVNADKQVQQLHAGGTRDLHEVMIAMEEADISLRLLVQVRNKALEAYQEIMRLQV